MNKRTRLLAFIALGFAGLFVLGLGARSVILKPLREIDEQALQLRAKLKSIDAERKTYLAADSLIQQVGGRLFGARTAEAEAAMGTLITTQIAEAGLRESDFTRMPAGRRRLAGAEEIGWSVQGEGPLPRILDLLFLLQSHPRLHRLDSLALSPVAEAGRVRLRFRFLTLVLNPAPNVKATTQLALPALDSAARRAYDPIAQRDLLRPFQSSENVATTPEGAPVNLDAQSLRVVSISAWGTAPEAHLLDSRNQSTRAIRPGEPLLDGQVAEIDLRTLPAAGKPGLLSYSRLIWRVSDEFWAVDTGQSLAERRRLSPEELPPTLSRVATPHASP